MPHFKDTAEIKQCYLLNLEQKYLSSDQKKMLTGKVLNCPNLWCCSFSSIRMRWKVLCSGKTVQLRKLQTQTQSGNRYEAGRRKFRFVFYCFWMPQKLSRLTFPNTKEKSSSFSRIIQFHTFLTQTFVEKIVGTFSEGNELFKRRSPLKTAKTISTLVEVEKTGFFLISCMHLM